MGSFYRISWAGTGAIYYKVYWSSFTGPRPVIFENTTQNTYYDLLDLTENINTYQVQVEAYCQDPNLTPARSPWTPFATGTLKCDKPGPLIATSSSTSLVIAWTGKVGDKYNIYLNGVLVAANYLQSSFTFTGLTPFTSYTIEVRTNCTNGYFRS